MLSRRDFIKLGGISLLATVAAGYLPVEEKAAPATASLVWHGSRKRRYLAFTYDDCYRITEMHLLEKLLDQYPGFKVTFFPTGLAMLATEKKDHGIWKRIADKGHEIGYHTYEHVNIGVMSPAGAIADYDRWKQTLTEVVGREIPANFVRPPYDIVSPTLNVLCLERGLVAALFSIGGGGPKETVMNAIRKFKNGDIVQMHVRNTTESQDYDSSVEAYKFMKENKVGAATMTTLYNDVLRDQIQPDGCDLETGLSVSDLCID